MILVNPHLNAKCASNSLALFFNKKFLKKITEKALDAEQGPNYMNLPTVLLIYLHSGK